MIRSLSYSFIFFVLILHAEECRALGKWLHSSEYSRIHIVLNPEPSRSEEKAAELGMKPLAKVITTATASKEPEWFTTAPSDAINNALERADMSISEIDLFEINEAFSCISLANNQILQLNPEKVNVNGGAVALGHPIGASGARILTTLLYAMKDRDAKKGIASLCNGGGEATAIIVELI